jgi:Protein of unknown function (DUF2892).
MFTNESALDRIIRLVVGIALALLFFGGAVRGTLGIIVLVIGAILVITGAIGFCPLYSLIGIRTKKA